MPCQALSPVVSGPAGKRLGKIHSCPYKIKIFKKIEEKLITIEIKVFLDCSGNYHGEVNNCLQTWRDGE